MGLIVPCLRVDDDHVRFLPNTTHCKGQKNPGVVENSVAGYTIMATAEADRRWSQELADLILRCC